LSYAPHGSNHVIKDQIQPLRAPGRRRPGAPSATSLSRHPTTLHPLSIIIDFLEPKKLATA
jgi:hypothetical protein